MIIEVNGTELAVRLVQESNGERLLWVVICDDPDLAAQGDTPDDAMEAFRRLAAAHYLIEAKLRAGWRP